jgi:hypothetical protein
VIYNEMVQRLHIGEDDDPEEVRLQFNRDLSVLRWQVPGGGNKYAEVEIEEGAPSWWAGDEEASQSALASMRAMGAKI